MAVVLFLLSCLSLLIWCVLLFARGGFWRARPAAPLAHRAARRHGRPWPPWCRPAMKSM